MSSRSSYRLAYHAAARAGKMSGVALKGNGAALIIFSF